MTQLDISKILVNNKYPLDCKFDSAVFVVDIPKVSEIIFEEFQKNEKIVNRVKALLLLIEDTGEPVDGFRFREIALELKELTSKSNLFGGE
jgi:hypothetical protein